MNNTESTDPGDKSAAEIEHEVEAKRAEVEEDLLALQHRMSPGQIVDQLFDYAKTGNGAEFTRNFGRSMRDNPIPLALMGVGMAWLMASGNSGPKRHADDDDDDLYDEFWDDLPEEPGLAAGGGYRTTRSAPLAAGGPTTGAIGSRTGDASLSKNGGSLKDKAGKVVEDAKGMAGQAADRITDAGHRVGDAMHDTRDEAARYGRRARRGARRYADRFGHEAERYGRRAKRGFFDALEEQPLVLGAIGVAIGAALGAALPATAREDESMGETRDALKQQAVDSAYAGAEKASDMADAAYGAAKEEAEQQGLTPNAAKSEAGSLRDKAAKVAEAAGSAAEKEAAKS